MVRFSSGQSNLLTYTPPASSCTKPPATPRAVYSFKTSLGTKNCFPFRTNFVSALDRNTFFFFFLLLLHIIYILFKWSVALPARYISFPIKPTPELVCRNSISDITYTRVPNTHTHTHTAVAELLYSCTNKKQIKQVNRI
jgi:hypothetical protein